MNNTKAYLFLQFFLGCVFSQAQVYQAQVYVEKQTRHRFAQLNLGVDYQVHLGGEAVFLNQDGSRSGYDLNAFYVPRFVIGGTHFWGHADFYIAISLYNQQQNFGNRSVQYITNVETALKYYPWRIEYGKLRPFVGVMLAPFVYSQTDKEVNYGKGPALVVNNWPLISGLTYSWGNQLLELGCSWIYNSEQEYYLSRTETAVVTVPPLSLNFSYRMWLETTLGAEKNWENGKTNEITKKLAENGGLNSFFLGVGISSMFWNGQGSYNTAMRPYIGRYDNATFADFAMGYYLHNPDLNIMVNYRRMKTSAVAYGSDQELSRESVGLELTKFLFDYHGFVPFVGPIVSFEKLDFMETFENSPVLGADDQRAAVGLSFGWDIRPNRLQSFILRTNLRWYPRLDLAVATNQNVSFGGLEFNFIQLIIYPGRMF